MDLSSLDESFSEFEALKGDKAMPNDKAIGSDGFFGAFFKSYWFVIKDGIMELIHAFSNLHFALALDQLSQYYPLAKERWCPGYQRIPPH